MPDISVVVVEKGSEVGAHILSGAVIDPVGLDRLLPDWRTEDTPIKTAVTDDRFYWLGANGALRLPNLLMPPLMGNHGNFIVSLGNVCRWLAGKAEALGVEIYPGFAAAEVLFGENGAVAGVATGDMGIGKNGEPKDSLHPRHGAARQIHAVRRRRARQPRQAAHRALSASATAASRRNSASGLKELWQVAPDKHRKGLVQHSFGWPLDNQPAAARSSITSTTTWCRSASSCISITRIPYLSPFEEFQRFKTHPLVRDTFAGGKRLAYGARAITEGGWQSVPKLTFPGGALIGCAAGFINVPRIKGSHNAMLSGMLAAEAAAAALAPGRSHDELADYEAAWRDSDIGKDLWRVRNAKPLWSKFGTLLGIALGGFDMWTNTLGFSLFGTLRHGKPDYATLKPAAECTPIAYPKPDGKLTFDRLSSVFLSNTNHEEDQPVHLQVADMALQKTSEHDVYAGPSARYCPAGVYEWVRGGRRREIRDQRAELRPLQDLRHQGPESEHHLGAAGRRRRAELSEYVMSGAALCGHDAALIGAFKRGGGYPAAVLAGPAQKGHSRPNLAAWRSPRGHPPQGASPVTSSSLARRIAGTALAAILAAAPIELSAKPPSPQRPFRLDRRPAAISPPAMPASSATPGRRRILPRRAARRSQERRTARPRLPVAGDRRRHHEAAKFAERVVHVDKNDRVARLVLGVHALKQKHYPPRAATAQSVHGPITDLTATLLAAWSESGSGDVKARGGDHRQAQGAGLVRHLQGPACRPDPRSRRPREGSRQALRGGLQARSTALRVVEAYGSWLSRNKARRGAQGLRGLRQGAAASIR